MHPAVHAEERLEPSHTVSTHDRTHRVPTAKLRSGRDGSPRKTLAEERALMERIQAGDSEAFAQLYEEHVVAVKRFILRQVRDAEETEDLTHETFVEALRSVARFEGRSQIRTWLFGIARHVCLHFFRFSGRWMTGYKAVGIEPDPGVDERLEARVEATRCLDRIGEIVTDGGSTRSARIFSRRYVDGSTLAAIAQDIGVSRDVVKSSLNRSRKRITRALPELPQILAGT